VRAKLKRASLIERKREREGKREREREREREKERTWEDANAKNLESNPS